MTESTLAERLVRARTEAGLTQEELAALVGLKQQSITDLEVGRSLSSGKVGSLAHFLRVHAYWLETGRGPMRLGDAVRDEPSVYLADDERELLRLFRKMKPDQRRGLIEFLTRR